MEIFKFFNSEWPVINPEKLPAESCCTCIELSKKLQEKHENLMSLFTHGEEVQKQLQEIKENEKNLEEELQKKRNATCELSLLLQEYETLLLDVMNDRDRQLHDHKITSMHLANLEFSFSDVHAKYERTKATIENYRINEQALLDAAKQNEQSISEMQQKYDQLKENSREKLEEANETFRKLKESHEVEINKLKTKIKRLDITVNSLEQTLNQKIVENQKLSTICDDFIKK